ncbi:MAG: hypothetical protein ACYDBB_06750 [Armatimonadota bacterium]
MMTELLIMKKRIDLDASPILYDRPFSPQSLIEDWEVRNADWYYANNAFIGRNPLPTAGSLLSRSGFPGNILMDFYGQTVLPSTHDIDAMWNVSWNEETNDRDFAYVLGVQGWWSGKIGIEKSPEYKLVAAAPSPWFVPGQEYHIQCGSIDGHCFVFVDDQLRIELVDPNPIDSLRHNRLGFEAYQTTISINNLTVRQIAWEPLDEAYAPEFG